MSRSLSAALVLGVLVLCGCTAGAGAGDKSGSPTVVLRLAAIEPVDDNPQHTGPATFVEQLEAISDGRLRVEVDTDTYVGHGPDTESDLVAAIASGEVDGGWPASRAFAAAGIEGFEILEAPLALDSHDAVAELVGSSLTDDLLARLDGSGVVPLTLTAGPLRRPFSVAAPLLGPDTWTGQRVRSYNSPVQDAALEALGATPVRVGTGWIRLVTQGDLDALEMDIAQYHANGSSTEARHLTTDVVLWPKVFVPSLSQARWDSLSEQQREWVSQAATAAREASVAADYDDRGLLEELCSRGLETHEAGPTARERLGELVSPVIDAMAADPLWPELAAIAGRHRTDSLSDVVCIPRAEYELATRVPVPDTTAEVPDGTYRVSLSSDEVEAALGPGKSSTSGVWTLRVSGGTYELDCVPHEDSTGSDCDNTEDLHGTGFDGNPMMSGRIHGDDDLAYFVNDPQRIRALSDCTFPAGIQLEQESCYPRTVDRVNWSFDGTHLTLTDLVADIGTWQYVVKPWRLIDG